eukprot:1563586-Ditylum_brightwellii.AAC.1
MGIAASISKVVLLVPPSSVITVHFYLAAHFLQHVICNGDTDLEENCVSWLILMPLGNIIHTIVLEYAPME